MNKKNIFIIIAVILSIIAIATIIYFNSKDKESEINNEEKEQAVLEQDGFSINIPDGWEEINGVQGVLAMISNVNEENEGVALENMGFKSYFAVAYEDMPGIDPETYVAGVEDQIFSNPLPQVLILTAIVVGVSTLSLGLAMVVRISECYGTIEENEILDAD
jgi:multicomponent Na+:H+ antiporter subunit C